MPWKPHLAYFLSMTTTCSGAGSERCSKLKGVDVIGEADTGRDALAQIGVLAPDVVVMDLNMPGITGVGGDRRRCR